MLVRHVANRADLELARAYPKRKLGIVAKNLLDRFESLWQFAHVDGVEPTNNLQNANFGNG